jgi:FkbH-like protein
MADLSAVVTAIVQGDAYRSSQDALTPASTDSPRRRPIPDPYLSPDDLEVTDVGPHRVLLIGACFVFGWPSILAESGEHLDVEFDRVLFANVFRLPEAPPQPIESYDCQIVQVPLQSVVPDLDLLRLDHDDPAAYEALLERAGELLELFLKKAMVWSDRVPTFVPNYLVPQQNPMGRLMPRYDLRNPIYMVERMNMELDRAVSRYRNARVIDVNHIAGVCGRRFIQEDMLWPQFHGQMMEGNDKFFDQEFNVTDYYETALPDYMYAVWREVRAAYRILKGTDSVKMLCVDLDNTMWRGIVGEHDLVAFQTVGWPSGLSEILLYLKRRGILLVIASKNEESRVRERWDAIFEGKLLLDDFAIIKINWKPKADNIAEAMAEANILPKNVVFMDDNPVERAAVKAAFPEIRTLECSYYYWRRVLAGAAEMQVAAISNESARRTEMVQAQVGRDRVRQEMSREDFLTSLQLRMSISSLRSPDHPDFPRAFELINKTNQFNTTGQRWSDQEASDFLAGGGVWWTFDVTDRFSSYGLVGVACVEGSRIDQFVMSCRVAGLDVEQAFLSVVCGHSGTDGTAEAILRSTDYNAALRDLYARFGWQDAGDVWRGPAEIAAPSHIRILSVEADRVENAVAVVEEAKAVLPEAPTNLSAVLIEPLPSSRASGPPRGLGQRIKRWLSA